MYDAREPLIQGTMYRIRYKIPGFQLVAREACMKLIDLIDDGQTLVFSARPRFGTQEIPFKYVIDMECVAPDALVYVDWKVNSKRPPQKWKYER
jgi:hypothetical protein